MRILPVMLTLLCAAPLTAQGAFAAVDIRVDLSTQTMHVNDNGRSYIWPVSTARAGFVTPRGVYHPVSLQAMHYSHEYDMAPMPHSIFFHGGYAIHGTYEAGLGRPESHGCVRLSAAHAAQLFSMVKADGARISISGSPPVRAAARSRRPRTFAYVDGAVKTRPIADAQRPYAPLDPGASPYPTDGAYHSYPSYTYGRVWIRDQFPQ
jgi:hypothetical protein